MLVSINKCIFMVVVSLLFIANIYSNVIPDYNQLSHQEVIRSVGCNNREIEQGEIGKPCLFFSNDQRCELKCSKRCSFNGNSESICCEVLPTCSCFLNANSEVASFNESMSSLDTLNPSISGCRTLCVEKGVDTAVCAKTRIMCPNQNYNKGSPENWRDTGSKGYMQHKGERTLRGSSGNAGAPGIRSDPGPSGEKGNAGASVKGNPGYKCYNEVSSAKGAPGPNPDLDGCQVKCVVFCTIFIFGYSYSYCCKAEPSC